MKSCPLCLAEIPDEARKCMFCGEWVTERPAPAPEPPPAAAPAAAEPPPSVVPVDEPLPMQAIQATPPAPKPQTISCRMCGAPMGTDAVLCLECGYDTRTGRCRKGFQRKRLRTDRVESTDYGRPLGML